MYSRALSYANFEGADAHADHLRMLTTPSSFAAKIFVFATSKIFKIFVILCSCYRWLPGRKAREYGIYGVAQCMYTVKPV